MLIGLCSVKPQVGKSTAANYLIENGYTHYEMSHFVEKISYHILGYNGNKLDSKERKKLQVIGLLIKNEIPDYWIVLSLSRTLLHYENDNTDIIELYHSYLKSKEFFEKNPNFFDDKKIVISGIRSQIEAEYIRKFGGRSILIDRKIESFEKQDPVECQLSGYKKFYSIISNNGSFKDLENEILNFSSEKPIFTIQNFKSLSTDFFGGIKGHYNLIHPDVKDTVEKYNLGVNHD